MYNKNIKKTKKTILVDLDSVLVPWVEAMLERLKEIGINEEVKNIKTYNYLHDKYGNEFIKSIYNENNFYKNLEPFDGAVTFLNNLNEKYSVKIVTVSGSEHNQLSKASFIEKHFGGLYEELIFEKQKYLIKGDALVDDSFENIYDMISNQRILSICYNHENRYEYNDFIYDNSLFKKALSYSQVELLLEKHLN